VDKQEPVAVFRREILGRGQIFWLRSSDELPNETPLYTAPPQPEPTIDGWPLWSGLPQQEEQGLTATPLPAIKLQDERESQYKSFAQSAQVIGIPEQEPVGWIGYFEGNIVSFLQDKEQLKQFLGNTKPAGKVVPVYMEPPKPTKLITVGNVLELAGYVKKKEWVGLTDEDHEKIYQEFFYASKVSFRDLSIALEAKLKEKNT
jgi:hypothetical protein